MGAVKEVWEDIHYLLDTTRMSCQEIADELDCPVEWVNEIVEERWLCVVGETMSPFDTCNS